MGPQPRPSPGARSIDWRTNALAPVTAAGTLCPWARAQAIALEKAQPVPWVELELRRGAESVSTYSTPETEYARTSTELWIASEPGSPEAMKPGPASWPNTRELDPSGSPPVTTAAAAPSRRSALAALSAAPKGIPVRMAASLRLGVTTVDKGSRR